MKLILLALTCAAFALVGIACTETATPTNTSTPRTAASPGSAATPAPTDEFANARANFAKNCEACHGPTGEGGLVKVDDKKIKVASLKAEHAIKHTDEQLAKTITTGQEEMPAFKDKLSQAEIQELVRYIRHHYQGK
jgi:mono/diheme cytochrome c family protein